MAADDLPGSTDIWKVVAPGCRPSRSFYDTERVFNRQWEHAKKLDSFWKKGLGVPHTIVGYKLEIENGALVWKELFRIN
jgi:hypothetical protein